MAVKDIDITHIEVKVEGLTKDIENIQAACKFRHNMSFSEELVKLQVTLESLSRTVEYLQKDRLVDHDKINELSGRISQLAEKVVTMCDTAKKKEDNKAQFYMIIITTVISAFLIAIFSYFWSLHTNNVSTIKNPSTVQNIHQPVIDKNP